MAKSYWKYLLIILGVLVVLLITGGLDGWNQEKPCSEEISLKNDVGWANHSDNVSTFEYKRIPEFVGESLVLEFNCEGTNYSTQTGAVELYYAESKERDFDEFMRLKNNTSKSSIFLEKAFIDRAYHEIRYSYVIVWGKEITYSSRVVPYSISGYRSEIIDEGNGTATVKHTPDVIYYFWSYIFFKWIIFSVCLIVLVLFIENRKK